jgi:site-specific DNA-cytosine methylase
VAHPGKRPKIVDLFAGAGGLGLGFSMMGYDVAVAVDNDPQACEAHRQNFCHGETIREDIFKIARDPVRFLNEEAKVDPESIDGVVGGPPCQGFSFMGERAASDERNLLTTKFMDVVLAVKPKFFVMENVTGLTSSGARPDFAAYVVRLGKPIGEPAARIAGELPDINSALAKRQPQFKKRLLSGLIESAKLNLAKSVGRKSALSNRVLLASTALEQSANLSFTRNYVGDSLIKAKTAWKNGLRSRVELAIALGAGSALRDEVVQEDGLKSALKSAAAKMPAALRRSVKEIIREFDSVPEATEYKGVKVGPILRHLILRASRHYDVAAPTILSAYEFGAPQNRRRLFLVGIRKDFGVSFKYPSATHSFPADEKCCLPSAPNCRDAIGDIPDVDGFENLIEGDEMPNRRSLSKLSAFAAHMRLERLPEDDWSLPREGWNPYILNCCRRTLHAKEIVDRIRSVGGGRPEDISGRTRLRANGVSHTLRAGTREGKGSHTAVRPIHYLHNRVISVREGARLMGYPDWMFFHPTKWHGFRLVGNGVPAQLSAAIARQIGSVLRLLVGR